tara:strand:- start:21611 stop:23077 length:1467 start_codon:yes stop_codon:yes gene_type:complete
MKNLISQVKIPKTKIICTLGPSTHTKSVITRLIKSGMSIARLNMSHGSFDSHKILIKNIKEISNNLNIPIGIMIDIPGTKYRIGPLKNSEYALFKGDNITITSNNVKGDNKIISVHPNGIHKDIKLNATILIDDGLIKLKAIKHNEKEIICKILNNGIIRPKKGITLPGLPTSLKFPGKKSIECLKFADQEMPDFIALSNITSEKDIAKAKSILKNTQNKTHIISKIERPEALKNITSIIQISDAIMVARGDLGVEVPISKVPIIQKEIISQCNKNGKPVITATQMLESMIYSSTPTRAEVTDVANSIYDGTDAIMLSAETSIGKYPVEAVKVMSEIAHETEKVLPYEKIIMEKSHQTQSKSEDTISYDASWSAYQLKAKLIVAFTESGTTASRVSRYRPPTKILALTPKENVQRKLTLLWGVIPVTVEKLFTVDDFFNKALYESISKMNLKEKDLLILVAGLPIGVPGGTNLLRIMTVPSKNENPQQ